GLCYDFECPLAPGFGAKFVHAARSHSPCNATFILIDRGNYIWFAAGAVLFGALTIGFIGWFDHLRRVHICKVPIVERNGLAASDAKGRPKFQALVVGSETNMNPQAKKAFQRARQQGGVSLCGFMSGYAGAGAAVNDPFAIWSRETLARVSNRLTMTLMGILLCAVMALYLAASSIEVHQRPVAKSENQLRIV